MMDEKLKFILFKKLLIFGAQGVGKTTLSSVLLHDSFKDEESSKNGKYIFLFNIFINRC
jgi:GTPase SAR1 family protein